MQPTEVVGTLKNKLDPLPRPESRVLSKKVVFWLFGPKNGQKLKAYSYGESKYHHNADTPRTLGVQAF